MGLEEGGTSLAGLENLINKVLADRESQKEQGKKIEAMEKDLRVVKGMICDKDGNCRLPTKGDLTRLAEAQGAKADLSEFTGQELWNQIKSNPNYERDIAGIHLKKLKEDQDYLKKALEDKALVGKMATLLCDDSGCRVVFNQEIDKAKAHKNGKAKGEKKFFLTKEK